MYDQRKTKLQLLMIIICAFGCSVASLSGGLAAMSLAAPAVAPIIS